jgi:hypothetical protein
MSSSFSRSAAVVALRRFSRDEGPFDPDERPSGFSRSAAVVA